MYQIIIHSLNALLMVAMPLALGVYLFRRLGAEWRVFGLGAIAFIASQVLHLPFNAWVLKPAMVRLDLDMDVLPELAVIALLLGCSAGVFEEVARYIGYRFWLTDSHERTWSGALMFGAGHGGIEAIILGVLVTYGFIQLFALKDASLEALIPLNRLEITRAQIQFYWSAPWYAAILGAVERAGTLCFHLSASVLVLQVFRQGRSLWLFLAIGWHAALDALAVFASQAWNIYYAEAVIAAAALLSLRIIFLLRKTSSTPEGGTFLQIEEVPIELEMEKPSLDHLEDSRYV